MVILGVAFACLSRDRKLTLRLLVAVYKFALTFARLVRARALKHMRALAHEARARAP